MNFFFLFRICLGFENHYPDLASILVMVAPSIMGVHIGKQNKHKEILPPLKSEAGFTKVYLFVFLIIEHNLDECKLEIKVS